jgi:hypothetical protein
MEFQGKPLKMFQLDCAFDRLEDRTVRDLLGGIFALRKQGYLSHHQYGILPVDAYDFIGTHFGIYIEGDEGIEVLTSYRMVEYSRCLEFKLAFPLETILKNSNAPAHLETLQRFMEKSQQEKLPLSYLGSWTIAPSTRAFPEVFKLVYDMFFAMNILACLESPDQLKLACGSLRLKTVRPIQWMGYEYFQDESGVELSNFRQQNLNNEEVMAMFFKAPSEKAIDAAKLHEFIFKKRFQIDRPEIERSVPQRIVA